MKHLLRMCQALSHIIHPLFPVNVRKVGFTSILQMRKVRLRQGNNWPENSWQERSPGLFVHRTPTSSHIPSAAAPGTPFFPGELPPGHSCRTRPVALRPFPPLELFKCFHCWVNSADAFRSQPIKLAPLCSQKKIIMFSLALDNVLPPR